MNIAVVGSRGFKQHQVIEAAIRRWMVLSPEGVTIVSGHAPRGADAMAEDIAMRLSLPTIIHPADWETHGKAAGFIRNRYIVRDADVVLAFFAPGPLSPGTSHTVSLAKDAGKPTYVFHEGKWL